MIFADKVISLRKKSGWSQEDLAEKMGVSRQSVSKWEGAQSVPDLSKILQLSQLFGVSTDYLLKDEFGETEYAQAVTGDEESGARRVSMEEANAFLTAAAYNARRIALGVLLCVFSPICLIMLGALSDSGLLPFSEEAAGAIGIMILLITVAPAVVTFIRCGAKTSRFEYLEKEMIDTEYGVTGMVKEKQKQFRDAYTHSNILGISMCIFSVIPLLLAAFLTETTWVLALGLCGTMLIAGCGAALFITVGVKWSAMEKLLQEGDYTKANKRISGRVGAISTAYWLLTVAVYLGYSLSTEDWKNSWIVWPVAGVLYAAIITLYSAFAKKDK